MLSAPARTGLRLAILIGLAAACSAKAPTTSEEAQRALERRLLAPCCWRQSLEDHDSPVAGALRAEIARRLAAGEPPAAIEADLVARHGDRIRALPPGGDPRWIVGALLVVALAGTLIGIGLHVRPRRPRRAGAVAEVAPDHSPERERYEQRLDDELLEM
jgi:cytochrome c-type biogenesis protein CcmH